MSTTKIYEYAILDHLLSKDTVKTLADEAFRGYQYCAAIISLEREHAVTYRDLVRTLVVQEAGEDIFSRIDRLSESCRIAKKALAESQKKAGKKRITRKARIKTVENTKLMALRQEERGAKKLRDECTKKVFEKFFYRYDKKVRLFSDREKLKFLCGTDIAKISVAYPELVAKHSKDYNALADAIIADRDAAYEQLKQLRKEQRQLEKMGKVFKKQKLLDALELRIKAYQQLKIKDNHLKRKLNLLAIDEMERQYPSASGWRTILEIRRRLDAIEHGDGKTQFPCSSGTSKYIIDARQRARKDSLGGSGSALSLPFCWWDKKLPYSDPFDGTTICGWQMAEKEETPDTRGKKAHKVCTPNMLFSEEISKFKATTNSCVPLNDKHFRERKVAQAGISHGWSPKVYTVDMLLRGKLKAKGIEADDRINFHVLLHREPPPNADIRWVYVKVWKKCNELRYTLQLVVEMEEVPVHSNSAHRQEAVALLPRWNPTGTYDLTVAATFPVTRNNEDTIIVCDSVRQYDGSYTKLSGSEYNIYRKKWEYAATIQKVSNHYFDKAKGRLHNIYTQDVGIKKVFDAVLGKLIQEYPSYSKVKFAYANRWRDHKKFRGFADALLGYYFGTEVINVQIWGAWRKYRFGGKFKTAYDAREAGKSPLDLFHDDLAFVVHSGASRDGWTDITRWAAANYDRLLPMASTSISKNCSALPFIFTFGQRKIAT